VLHVRILMSKARKTSRLSGKVLGERQNLRRFAPPFHKELAAPRVASPFDSLPPRYALSWRTARCARLTTGAILSPELVVPLRTMLLSENCFFATASPA
jgi:hypothetical protein